MRFCVSCGHELGVGRFCTNCGRPIDRPVDRPVDDDWRTGTAERPAVPGPTAQPTAPPPPPPPTAPPPPPLTPPPPRFPLYADESSAAADAVHGAPGSGPPTATLPVVEPTTHRESRPAWGLWALVVLVLVAVAGLGLWLVSDGDPGRPADQPRASTGSSASGAEDGSTGSADAGAEAAGGVLDGASVDVPRTAPPGQDVSGNPVDYQGDNLLDGVPETTWRMPGDGTGAEIVITLARESRLQQVGLINGYAKVARDAQGRELDWYHGNRRVTAVEWVFDDGTTISQDLEDTTAVQSVDVDTTTTTITLRLVSVSAPGTGRAARDYTAISDVSLVGRG